jgi:hypothetical protein
LIRGSGSAISQQKVIQGPANEHKVNFSMVSFIDAPLKIREVLFVDTADFRFYNNGSILPRRMPYSDGFPMGDPEVVWRARSPSTASDVIPVTLMCNFRRVIAEFRDPDMQKAAETDVRPQIYWDYQIKFKRKALPLRDRLGGIHRLFSHNVQFPISHVHEDNRGSTDTITRVFPVLARIRKEPGE